MDQIHAKNQFVTFLRGVLDFSVFFKITQNLSKNSTKLIETFFVGNSIFYRSMFYTKF